MQFSGRLRLYQTLIFDGRISPLFDLDSAKGVVTDILNTGDNRERILAAREIFKVVGAYAKDIKDNERDLGLQAAIAKISRIFPD